MKKIKILYTLNRARIAGTERHLLLLLEHLDRDRFDPHVVCLSEGPLIDLLQEKNIKAAAFPRTGMFDIATGWRLLNFIRTNRFDLVHSHCGQFSCFLSKLAGTPITIETRHGLCFNYDEIQKVSLAEYAVNRAKASLVNLTLTVCETDMRLLTDRFGVPAQKIRNVVNGIDVEPFDKMEANSNEFRQELGLESTTQIIGVIARFTAQKGLEYFIRAVHQLRGLAPGTHFVIVGDGELGESLRNLAKDLRLSDILTFTGYRQDAVALLSSFDIFVLPSLWEGLPYTILEAMALKKPVVTTNVFGNAEAVVDDQTGYLVPPRDAGALAAAIKKLVDNPDKAKKMGENGYKRAARHFSAKRMTEQIEKTYLELLTGESTRESPTDLSQKLT